MIQILKTVRDLFQKLNNKDKPQFQQDTFSNHAKFKKTTPMQKLISVRQLKEKIVGVHHKDLKDKIQK